jgi:hypothetical protein
MCSSAPRAWRGAWRRRLIGAAAGLACAACLSCGAAALASGTSYVDGISDQNLGLWSGSYVDPSGFTAPFTGFFASSWVGSPPSHLLYARFVTAPDAVAQGGTCEQNLRNWYEYVTGLHLIPVIAVWDVAEGGCADNGAPPTDAYAADITQLLGYLDGLGTTPVQYLEAWNEPNASGVSAAQAAAYWGAASTICASDGCTAIAGDLVDTADQSQAFSPGCSASRTFANFTSYEQSYVTALGAARPAIWGLHPYTAVNCEESTSVTDFAANLPSPAGELWFTEVGAWECRLGQSTPRGVTQQNADATYLVDTLMSPSSPTAPAHVFWYELAASDYTQNCSKYADSALYEATSSPGPLYARPAAQTVFGADTSLGAVTGAPHDVTSSQATFDGVVTPAGIEDADYYFEYGPTSAYGSQTPPVPLSPGLAAEPVSATVTGLTAGTPYHYQLVVTDAGGLSRDGGDAVMPPVLVGASANTVPAGGAVTATWSGISDPSPSDWIGVYQPGAPDSSPLSGFYVDSCTTAANGATAATGSCGLTLAATSGTYELRLYSGQASGLLATSGPISVPSLSASASRVVFGTPLTVSWSGVANATGSDWIGVYRPGASASTPVASLYDDSCTPTSNAAAVTAGTCTITLPPVTGTYELKLYESPSTGPLATSGRIIDVPPVPVVRSAPKLTFAAAASRAVQGAPLSCSTGRWSNAPTGYTYRWLQDGHVIVGPTAATYVPGRIDVARTLWCDVTASNAGGTGARAASNRQLVHSAPPGTLLLGDTVDRHTATVTVRFRATGAASAIGCALVRGAGAAHYSPCRSPLILRTLRPGDYTLRIRTVGPGGVDPTPITLHFTLP